MKMSTKGRYGLRLMLDVDLNRSAGPVLLKDISRRQGISEKYLWQLIPHLKNAGLIKSTRGAKGGYLLGKHPSKIRLSDIVSVLEGPMCIVDCVNNPALCERSSECASRDIWKGVSESIFTFLSGITLEQLAEKQKHKNDRQNYYI